MKPMWVSIVAAALMAGGACVSLSAPARAANGNPDDKREVARGEVVYREHCASCHGHKLEGERNWQRRKPDGRMPAPPHDSSGHTWHHTDQQIFRVIKGGMKPPVAPEGYQSDMPAFENVIGDEDIWATIAFIKSKWSPAIRARHKARSGPGRVQGPAPIRVAGTAATSIEPRVTIGEAAALLRGDRLDSHSEGAGTKVGVEASLDVMSLS